MKVVSNTSPIILLAKIGQLDILVQLYDEIIVPASVLGELQAKHGSEIKQIESFFQIGKFQNREATWEYLNQVPSALGSGEQEAIALAVEHKADLVILDDQEGRRIARQKSLVVTGTIGVLIEAREQNLIKSISYEMDRLIEAGMWLDELFYHRILREFGE